MAPEDRLELLADRLVDCRQCPRLVEWRENVAANKRAAFREDEYWGLPVPGFGDPDARLVIVGLAPAAHGANRTGRMFTGDRSGDWLYRALYRAGFANQPESRRREDGLELADAWITSAVRCAPPANKPTAEERDRCAEWLDAELELLNRKRVFLALGQFGYQALWRYLVATGAAPDGKRPRFGHGLEVSLQGGKALLASYHPSQQNTFTGRLTEKMFDSVFARAGELLSA